MYHFEKQVMGAARLLFCCLTLFCMSCASTQPKSAPPEDDVPYLFINELAAALDAGDIDEALALFDSLSPEDAELRENRMLKASVMLSAGDIDGARAITEALISEDGGDIESRFILSNIEGASGRSKERRTLLEGIIKDTPDHVPSLNALGQIFIVSKSLRQAASYFDRALALEPDNMSSIAGRANVYRLEYKNSEAEELFNKLVALYPEYGESYSERGRFYRETGNLKQALDDLSNAQKFDPGSYWVSYDKGRVLLELRRREEALVEFDNAIKINPEIFISYVYSAGIRDELEDVDGAARDYEALVRLRPDYYFALEGLGVQLMKKGLYANAAQAFAAAYKAAPTAESNYAMLAAVNMLKSGGKPNEVKPFIEQAMKKVDRSKLDYHVLRLFFDLSGDSDVARRIDQEKSERTKAQMLFYLANYYDIKGNNMLANKFFVEFHDMRRMDLVEWRLNEWILKNRNIQLGDTGGASDVAATGKG
ncbi:MAG: tetratricopeptide repeat protein [Spirochaetaceae bacterium]|jgi:tetratricopeptide (TPR) repeat protein|nr:tetratricopeptide repeat protein [Spirochaetaceae bacterium]